MIYLFGEFSAVCPPAGSRKRYDSRSHSARRSYLKEKKNFNLTIYIDLKDLYCPKRLLARAYYPMNISPAAHEDPTATIVIF